MNESIEETYYQKSRDVILNRVKDYYKNDQERLKEHAIQKRIEEVKNK